MIEIFGNSSYINSIKDVIKSALKHLSIPDRDVSVEIGFLDPIKMQELNKKARGIDRVTDVLSFPNLEFKLPYQKSDYEQFEFNPENNTLILGEIFICLEQAQAQALELEHSLESEVSFLALHGLLHLLGFDHENDEDSTKMNSIQDIILNNINMESYTPADVEEKKQADTILTGAVALIGMPNSGKSTLINALVGEKVSIVSHKPQTTRNEILGVMNIDGVAQIIFLDTPGMHSPRNELGKFMMRSVTSAIAGADIALYLVDAEKGLTNQDVSNISKLTKNKDIKVVIAVNKIDHITKPRLAEILTQLNDVKDVDHIIPISALRKRNLNELEKVLVKYLTPGPIQYDETQYTNRSMRFMASEVIREKTLQLLEGEVPFGIGVIINKYNERPNGIIDIDASIICQKDSHKPILIGKSGEMLKKIGTYARRDLEKMVDSKIFLTLFVKVREEWRDDASILNELGYLKME